MSSVTFVHVDPWRSGFTLVIRGQTPLKFASSGTRAKLAECPKCRLWPVSVTAGFPRSTLRSDSRLWPSTGVLGFRVTFLRHVSAKPAVSRLGLLRMCWISSLTCSSGNLLSELTMKSALDVGSGARVAIDEASRLVPTLVVLAWPPLVRRLSLSAS